MSIRGLCYSDCLRCCSVLSSQWGHSWSRGSTPRSEGSVACSPGDDDRDLFWEVQSEPVKKSVKWDVPPSMTSPTGYRRYTGLQELEVGARADLWDEGWLARGFPIWYWYWLWDSTWKASGSTNSAYKARRDFWYLEGFAWGWDTIPDKRWIAECRNLPPL